MHVCALSVCGCVPYVHGCAFVCVNLCMYVCMWEGGGGYRCVCLRCTISVQICLYMSEYACIYMWTGASVCVCLLLHMCSLHVRSVCVCLHVRSLCRCVHHQCVGIVCDVCTCPGVCLVCKNPHENKILVAVFSSALCLQKK